jgi:hypothetical protein
MADLNSPRPQLQRQARPVQEAVVANQHSYGGAPQGEGPLDGLVRGLASLNPALARYQQVQDHQGLQDAAAQGRAAAETIEAPRDALTGAPMDLPDSVPQAYSRTFRQSLGEALAQRVGVQNKMAAISEYADKRLEPDFHAPGWLAEKRAEALKGISDPHAQAIIGQHFTTLEAELKQEAERERVVRRDEARASTMSQLATDMFTADMSPDRIHEAYPSFLERAKGLGYTPKESAQFLYTQLAHMSNKLGGAPELFDVFDRKDPEGLSLTARNPQLAPHVDEARRSAVAMRDKRMLEEAEKGNARALMGYESDIDTAPEKVTMDRILADMTPYGAVRSEEKAASLWGRAQDSLKRRMATQAFMSDAEMGRLWIHDPKDQSKVLDSLVGPMVQGLAQATSQGDVQGISQIGQQLMALHSRTGATVPVDQLQRYVQTMVSNLPNKQGPTAQFTAAAELYKVLSGNPQYRDLYFKDDTAKLMESYVASTGSGSDSKAAYDAAYQAISPEAKTAAEAYTKTPEFQKRLKDVQKSVSGSSWVPRWIGGNGRPENLGELRADVAGNVRSFLQRNPSASDEQVQGFVEQWTAQNYALDTSTHLAVKVPPGLGGQAAQSAISAYSERLSKEFKLASRSDADWQVQFHPVGTEGAYNVVLFNGMASHPAGTVTLQELLRQDRASKVLSDEEKVALSGVRQGLKAGTLPDLDPRLLAKAEALKVFSPEELGAYKAASLKQFQSRIQAIPAMSFGKPSFDNLQFVPGRSNIDTQLTSRVATELLSSPLFGPDAHHQSYAASLITMGESVALRAYQDPAKDAGSNIGMGYNLKANAASVNADLKRAGVPEEAIEAVKSGKAELTPDQAKRLLMVAMPRYEKQVHDLAESTQTGLWGRMTPAQKAVMIDVAWQVGDAGQFKRAWEALSKGDQKAFAEETKVTYVDRSGERREDTRRNNLRASMLAGMSFWDTTVQKFGSLPSSKLQALAATSK